MYSMKSKDLIFTDYRRPLNTTLDEKLVAILRGIGFIKENEGLHQFKRNALRILLNPSPELMRMIRRERNRIGPSEYQIGVHVRCGGNLSDVPERTAMVTPEILKTLPDRIRATINASSIPSNLSYVYLATDSTIAANQLKESLFPIQVRMTQLYTRGHSEYRVLHETTLRRSIIELYLMVPSNRLLLMVSSGFSRMIAWITTARRIDRIRALPVILKNVSTLF